MKVILIVGSNPSSASPTNEAFHDKTNSRKLIDYLLEDINGKLVFMNVADFATPGNKALSAQQIKESVPLLKNKISAISPTAIIAVGKTASTALSLCNTQFLPIPHTSGRCRVWNSFGMKELIKRQIAEYIMFK